jgi:thiamine-monophosphate kinase
LRHICQESGVGALVEASAVPIHDDALLLMQRDGRSPLDHALHDGEDYELLFTAKARTTFLTKRIGTITEEKGVWLQADGGREPLEPKGWEHRL